MNELELTNAILRCRPDSEFSFKEADYSTVKWDILEGMPPTLEEIEEAHAAISLEKANKDAELIAAKNLAQSKLTALGLTADDLKALGL
jgi:hypothetical protein